MQTYQQYQQPPAAAAAPYGAGVAAVGPPVEQDMIFQWVDTPSYGRPVHQQHYLQGGPPLAPPYYHGMEQPLAPLGPQGFDPRSPSQLLDPHFASGQGANVPPAYGGLGGQRRELPYGQGGRPQGGADGYYDQRRAGQGARATGNARGGARGAAAGGDEGKGGRNRQPTAGGGRDGGSGAGAGGRRGAEQSADAQAAAVLESLGTEGLRQTLTSILESLYEDRIKPLANYVKGRLKERSTPEPIVKSFVELYAQHPELFIVQQPTSGSQADEPTIFFVTEKEPSWFKGWVDIDSPEDPYDEKIWQDFAKFLDGEHTFAGGRYGMARELTQRKLSFLEPLSLGEICHMVQLALQHRKLIVYHRKMLKPIQTVLCALPPSASADGDEADGEEIRDMDDLCVVLFRMLAHHPDGIRLCRMKQMIKHELSRKLSEMAFKCTKLIELFNLEPLTETFVLDTESDGKSIYVKLGDPAKFDDHVKQLHSKAFAAEPSRA